jgi:hypothetical protein
MPTINLPTSSVRKEVAVAVTREPRTTQRRDMKPTCLIPYLPTIDPAGRLRKIPGKRTSDISNAASASERMLNSAFMDRINGGATCKANANATKA